jgi:Zn-dependent protease/CBS domain-containing protein
VTPTFRLGRFAGVEVGINWTWLIVVALVAWSLADAVFPETNPGLAQSTYVVMAVVAVPIFFACLLLHELGHATQARREGMTIDGITLWLFGGVARFRGSFPSAGAEFRIAIAGPLVSLALGAAFLGVSLAAPLPSAVDGVVYWLGSINLILLAFNLLPALPLDGGRVLRSALWQLKGDFAAATRMAAGLGRIFGQMLIILGLFLAFFAGSIGGLWFAMIGWFLLLAAQAEADAATTHVALAGLHVRDAMVAFPATVDADLSLERFMDEVFLRHRYTAYPVVQDGSPAGLITFRAAAALPRAAWPSIRVGERMTPLQQVPAVHADDALEEAWASLLTSPLKRALVLDDGRLTGLLSATDVLRILEAAGTAGRPIAGPRQSDRPSGRVAA